MSATCLNCAAVLGGEYCARCGQRDERDVRSLGHFLSEAAESLTHADSRLWRTLGALLVRPGFLSREFFAGRRARYLPPFRLYLVISVAFFLLAAALPTPEAGPGSDPRVAAFDGECGDVHYQGPGADWLQPRLRAACIKVNRDGGRALTESFVHNVPRALFIFLPLLAGVMMLVYWRPRRYYVEHLLLLVYNHSCAFVAFGLMLVGRALLPWSPADGILTVACLLYLGWYCYRSLRVAYGQSRGRSFAKFVVLSVAYMTLGMLTLVVAAIYSFASL
jgi:hypothetical protein